MSEIDINLRVKVDDSQLEKDLKAIERRSDLQIIPKIDTDIFASELEKLKINPLLIPVELNTSKASKQLDDFAKEISSKSFALNLEIDRSKLDPIFKDFKKQLSGTELRPKVDHEELILLNQHLDLKIKHLDKVNKHFSSNPIKVVYDDKSTKLIREEIKTIDADYKKLQQDTKPEIEFKVITQTNPIQTVNNDLEAAKENIKEIQELAKEGIELETIVKKPKEELDIKQELEYSTNLAANTKLLLDNSNQELSQTIANNGFITNNFLKNIHSELIATRTEVKNLANKANFTLAVTAKFSALDMGDLALSFVRLDFGNLAPQPPEEGEEEQDLSNVSKVIKAEVKKLLSAMRIEFNNLKAVVTTEAEGIKNAIYDQAKNYDDIQKTIVVETESVRSAVVSLQDSLNSPLSRVEVSLKTNTSITKSGLFTLKSTLEVQTNQIKSILKEINRNLASNPVNNIFASLIDNIRNELTKDFASSFAKNFFQKSTINPEAIGGAVGGKVGDVAKFGVDIGKGLNEDFKKYFGLVFERLDIPGLSKTFEDLFVNALLKVAKSEKGISIKEALRQVEEEVTKNYKESAQEGELSPKAKLEEVFKELGNFSNYSFQLGDALTKELNAKYKAKFAELEAREAKFYNRKLDLTPEEQAENEKIKKERAKLEQDRERELNTAKRTSDITINNAVTRAVGERIGNTLDKILKERRAKGLEKSTDLALKRAQEILTKTKAENVGKFKQTKDLGAFSAAKAVKSDATQVVTEATKELFITIGGFARRKNKDSGMRIASDIATGTDETISAIGVKNPDTEIPSEIQSSGDYERGTIGFASALSRPNLRGYSEDAVEMAAQAISALAINPEIKIKFVGESGGGFAAAEATKIMEELGYSDRVQGIGLGTPELVGGLEPKNFKKVLGKDFEENIGFIVQQLLAPLGFADISSPSQNLEGLKGHSYEFYRDRPEFQSFLQGEQDVSEELMSALERRVEGNKQQLLRAQSLEQVKEAKTRIGDDIAGLEILEARAKTQEQKEQLQKYIKTLKEVSNAVASFDLLIDAKKSLDKIKSTITQTMSSPDKGATKKLRQQIKSILATQGTLLELLNSNSEIVSTQAKNIFKELNEARKSIGTPDAQIPDVYKARFVVGGLKGYETKRLKTEDISVSEAELRGVINRVEEQKQNFQQTIDNIKEDLQNKKTEIQELSNQIKPLKSTFKVAQEKEIKAGEEIKKINAEITKLTETLKGDKSGKFSFQLQSSEDYKALREKLIKQLVKRKKGKTEAEAIKKQIDKASKQKKDLSAYIKESEEKTITEFENLKKSLESIQKTAREKLEKKTSKPKPPPTSSKPTPPVETSQKEDFEEDDREPPQPPPTKPKTPKTPQSGGGGLEQPETPKEQNIPEFSLPRVSAGESESELTNELAKAINQRLDIGIDPIVQGISKALDQLALEAGGGNR